ncbi:hypothetical protein RRG08_013055 [Elysia crispata]|uniref:Uncharacterized protein n=1 Tax=Elysia crispata TaxID=231223 RepID=A0AAE1DPY2_9GAST|nr:hypothetical protein RRG08_013055 [Elysia crispata]
MYPASTTPLYMKGFVVSSLIIRLWSEECWTFCRSWTIDHTIVREGKRQAIKLMICVGHHDWKPIKNSNRSEAGNETIHWTR